MGIWELLGLGGGGRSRPAPAKASETIRKISAALDELEPDKARYIALFAYILGRVAHADLEITDKEVREMERIVEGLAGLPEEQAVLVVQIAKTQNTMFGSAENFTLTQEFNNVATKPQKLALLNCLFAVSSSDESITTVEDNEIRQIATELRLDHQDFIAARPRPTSSSSRCSRSPRASQATTDDP